MGDILDALMIIVAGIILLSCGVYYKEHKHRKSFIRAGIGVIVLGVLYLISDIIS